MPASVKLAWLAHCCSRCGCSLPTAACNNGTKIQLCVGPAGLPARGGPRVYHGWSLVTIGRTGASSTGWGSWMRAGVHGRICGGDPRAHTQPRLPSRRSNARSRVPWAGHTGGSGMFCIAGGASHQRWCCSGGKSIQESTSYHACGERVPSACGGLAVPDRLPVTRPVPSLQGRCAGNIGATH